MPPVAPPSSSPLLPGQSTLEIALDGGLGVKRPARESRPGPDPRKKPRSSDTVLNRRLAGGKSELQVLQQFAEWRIRSEGGEPGDQEIAQRVVENIEGDGVMEPEEEETGDYKGKRYNYTREHKLAAISYFQNTWRKGNPEKKEEDFVRISNRYAAKKLKISRKMLRDWVITKERIINQKAGTKRYRVKNTIVKEQEMEKELNKRFLEARDLGRKISFKWFLRHAHDIYAKLYPQRVIRNENGKKAYLDFRFSTNWFRGFKRRYSISLRTGTKKAQKPPEELREVIEEWLRYNRRMTVQIIDVNSETESVREAAGSIETAITTTINAASTIPRKVGRFYLSEISNMDQSPLPWEVQKGRTYATKGSKTVLIRTARSGWDKRQCTLQILVFADGVQRCKPLLIYRGKPNSKDSRRTAEKKKYNPGVVVIFNEKAYANTKTTIDWVKSQFSHASAFPLSANEPRFLSLDAFAPHKNKETKKPVSAAEQKKREDMERLQAELRAEFKKLNTTLTIIPGGCTGYVQVLDVSVNKSIKAYIEEYEDEHIDQNIEQWKANKFTVGERRVLMTHWVKRAWDRYHEEHKETLIKTFQNVGLSLNPDGTEDHLLNIKDLLDITVGDWHRVPEPTHEPAEYKAIEEEENGDTIEVDIGDGITYIATKERTEGDISGEEFDSELENDSEADSNSGSEEDRYEEEEEED